MPSRFEGFPNALLESMAVGVVPIVAKINGVTDWIVDHGVNGFVCRQRDIHCIAKNIRILYNDRTLLKRMRKSAAKKVALKFSNKKMGSSYHKVFVETLNEAGPKVYPKPWACFEAIIINPPTWPRFTPNFVKIHLPAWIKYKIKQYSEL